MRLVSSVLLLVCLLLGAFAVASAHDDPAEQKLLEDRVKALELQVEYLRSREAALTAYLLGNETRAAGLEEVARRSREEGFEAASIPYPSRQILLRGMEELARSLRKDLPALSRSDQALLKRIGVHVPAGDAGR